MKENKSTKKNKNMKRKKLLLAISILIVVFIIILTIIYMNSEKYEKNKMEKLVRKWSKEYYTTKLTDIASEYLIDRANKGEEITINLDALKKFGKDITVIKNSKTDKVCDEINSYAIIKIEKNTKDIKKDYKIEKVVLDCFEK